TILLLLTAPAYAQTGTPLTATQLNTEINTKFPDQNLGAITPYILRQFNLDLVASSVLGQSTATAGQIPVYPGSGGAAIPTTLMPLNTVSNSAYGLFTFGDSITFGDGTNPPSTNGYSGLLSKAI